LAAIEKAAADKRNAIEDGLVSQAVAMIDAAPANPTGLQSLEGMANSPAVTALPEAKAAQVRTRAVARRDAIVTAIIDEKIKGLDKFPGTLDGFAGLEQHRANTDRSLQHLFRGLGDHAFAQHMRYETAAGQRITKLGRDAFGEFRNMLQKISAEPAEENIAKLDNAIRQFSAALNKTDEATRKLYVEPYAKAREDLVGKIKAEEVRLAALPLAGATFVDKDSGMKIEFRDRRRAYLTLPITEQMYETEYELDGDRVILRTVPGGGNLVLTKVGSRLKGGGSGFAAINLKRQATK
jgi:hypothetical protein